MKPRTKRNTKKRPDNERWRNERNNMENFKSIQKFLYLRETLEKYLSSSPMVLVAAYKVPKNTQSMHIMTVQSSFEVCQIGTLVTLTDDWSKTDPLHSRRVSNTCWKGTFKSASAVGGRGGRRIRLRLSSRKHCNQRCIWHWNSKIPVGVFSHKEGRQCCFKANTKFSFLLEQPPHACITPTDLLLG